MAALPPIRRFLTEDFKSQSSWIGPLLINLNNFVESVVNAFNKGITLNENTTGAVLSVTLTTPPTSNAPAIVAWTKSVFPVALLVGNITLLNNASFTLTTAVQVQFSQTQSGAISINNVVGLPTSFGTSGNTDKYVLTLIALAG